MTFWKQSNKDKTRMEALNVCTGGIAPIQKHSPSTVLLSLGFIFLIVSGLEQHVSLLSGHLSSC